MPDTYFFLSLIDTPIHADRFSKKLFKSNDSQKSINNTFLKCDSFAFSMNLILYTSLDNAFLQQGQQQEEEKDDFGSSRLSEEIIFNI